MADTQLSSAVASGGGERHASWLELFFDLVAVVGVSQLAQLLGDEPGWRDVGLYVVLYLAFWTNWLSLTLYGNVAGDRTRTRTLLLGMFGLTVMAAAVHGVQDGELGAAFAIGYVCTRLLGGSVFGDRREILLDWPTVSFKAGAVPWTVSIWVHGPARPWLWAAGVVIDLYVTFFFTKNYLLRALQQHRERADRRGRPASPALGAPEPAGSGEVTVARTDSEHLSERLGLFTIIVLGEGVYQLVEAASDAEWDHRLYSTGIGGFVMLVLVWSLSLRRGRGGIPCLGNALVPPRVLLGLHCLVTGALAALAAGLGVVVERAHGRLPEQTGYLMATALGVYLLVATVLTHRADPGRLPRLLVAAVPALALCAVAAVTDGLHRRPTALAWVLVLAVAWFAAWTHQGKPPE
ncbi:low temperature requirement protein A [Streptomyces sp. NPDC005423]|uniref:low temperature requirement protein A n=1 Tax=Streptomyces sp. NPDC005423 TaxID=3155343 RepID=UPI0033A1F12C